MKEPVRPRSIGLIFSLSVFGNHFIKLVKQSAIISFFLGLSLPKLPAWQRKALKLPDFTDVYQQSFWLRLIRWFANWGTDYWKRFQAVVHPDPRWIKVIELLILLLVAALPVVPSWGGLLGLLLLLSWLVSGENRSLRLNHGLLGLSIVVTVSLVFSGGWKTSGNGLGELLNWLLIAWLVGGVVSVRLHHSLVRTLVGSSALWIGIGLWQQVAGVPTPPGWLETGQSQLITIRSFSVFGNPNLFAIYLTTILILISYLLNGDLSRKQQILFGGIGLAGLVALYFTYSRTGWVLTGLFLCYRYWKELGRRRWLLALLFLVAAVAIPGIRIRLAGLFLNPGNTFWYRLQIWQGVLRALGDFWLWGIGPERFAEIYTWYQGKNIFSQHAHQYYLQFWLEFGLFSLIAFANVIRKLLARINWANFTSRALVLAIAAMLGFGLMETWYVDRFCGGYFWLLAGLLISYKNR